MLFMGISKTSVRIRATPFFNIRRFILKLKPKELAKIKKRQKLWSQMNWYWAYDINNTDGTLWTSDKNKSLGIGFFKHNHSLNCGCGQCKRITYNRRYENKRNRLRNRLELKQFNNLEEM